MKKFIVIFALAVLTGCAGSIFRPQSLTSPAITDEETVAVHSLRLAHGALREAAAALDLAYQYISRKALPCQGVSSPECAALKIKLSALWNQVHDKEVELEAARATLGNGDIFSAQNLAQTIKNALLLLQREIANVGELQS